MIWYDVLKKLEDSGLHPMEETYMENYGKILTAQRPEFRDRFFRCTYGVVRCAGIDVEFYLFPDELHRSEFMDVVGGDPWWLAQDNVVIHCPECDPLIFTRIAGAMGSPKSRTL